MLELIFQGFAEWVYGMILECWNYFVSSLMEIMSLDFTYLKAHIPVIEEIMQVILAVGWALLLGNLVFQAARSMLAGLGFEGEDPKLLFSRTFVFAFLLLASPQICETGLNIASKAMDLLDMPNAIDVHLVDDSLFGSLSASWLLVIIFDLILMFKVLKLLVEVAERYVILSMLTIMAPVAFATGGSRSTMDIFSGWCRMYGSMCVLMCTNVIFIKLLLSVVSAVPSGLDVFPWMVLILAIVKVAKKADAIITRIGLNPAITGDGLGSRLPGMLTYAVVRTMASNVTKAMGKSAGGRSAGGSGRGRGAAGVPPHSGGGGGPRSGGPQSGGPSGGYGGAAAATGAQPRDQQGGVQQGATYQSNNQTGTQQGSAQTDGQRPMLQGQGGETTFSSSSNKIGPVGGQQPSRKTSVPQGTHRSPSLVATAGSTTSATPGSGRPGSQPKAGVRSVQIKGTGQPQAKPGPEGTLINDRGSLQQRTTQSGTVGTPAKGGGPIKPGAVQPGVAGRTSKETAPARPVNIQRDTVETSAKGGGPIKPGAVQPGVAGRASNETAPARPVNIQHDTAGTPAKGGGPIKPGTVQPGTAGKPFKSSTPTRPGTVQPGIAGTPSKAGVPQTEATGQTRPGSSTRFTQVSSQRVQGGGSTAKVQAAEQNSITAPQQQTSPKTAQPGVQVPGTIPGHKAQPGPTTTHFTRRESRETQVKQAPTAPQTTQVSLLSTGAQPGTAGKGTPPASTHSTGETRQSGSVAIPARETAPVVQKPASPARQEPGRASVPAAPQVMGIAPQTRPDTAGTAATAFRTGQTRQTARAQTAQARSTPTATDGLGGQRAESTATSAEKGHLAPKGIVPPKKQPSATNHPSGPPRKDGGVGRGK